PGGGRGGDAAKPRGPRAGEVGAGDGRGGAARGRAGGGAEGGQGGGGYVGELAGGAGRGGAVGCRHRHVDVAGRRRRGRHRRDLRRGIDAEAGGGRRPEGDRRRPVQVGPRDGPHRPPSPPPPG